MCRKIIGGTYEKYSEEKMYKLIGDKYTVTDWGFYTDDGEYDECDFCWLKLSKALN